MGTASSVPKVSNDCAERLISESSKISTLRTILVNDSTRRAFLKYLKNVSARRTEELQHQQNQQQIYPQMAPRGLYGRTAAPLQQEDIEENVADVEKNSQDALNFYFEIDTWLKDYVAAQNQGHSEYLRLDFILSETARFQSTYKLLFHNICRNRAF